MKKLSILFVGIFSILALSAEAQNITVGGDITADISWDADTVFVDDTVRVLDDITLTVPAGTKVFFNDFYPILVEGTILSEGTTTDTILYSVLDTTGYSEYSHTGWDGFRFIGETDIANDNDTSRFAYCIFEYAIETEDSFGGAAIRFNGYSKANIEHCVFRYNFGYENGGAINMQNEAVVDITYCDFNNNFAGQSGGAISFGCSTDEEYFDQPVVSYCTFTNNSSNNLDDAYYGGGAIQIAGYYNTLVKNCLFTENHSESQGGALTCAGYAVPYIVNNVFVANSSIHNGGAIGVKYYASPYIINNTFLFNTSQAAGGAMSVGCDNDSLLFANNICRNNIAASSQEIYIDTEDEFMHFTNNNIAGGLDAYTSIIQTNNIDADPMFIDMMSGDIRLKCGSPCVNTALDTTEYIPETDILGLERLVDGMYDMGALESQLPVMPDLGPDFTMYDNETQTLDAGTDYESYLWNTTEETQTIEIDGALVGSGTYDYWVEVTNEYECAVRDSIVVTIDHYNSIAENNQSVGIYPNPNNGRFEIRAMDANVIIIDMKGSVIREFHVNNQKMVDLSMENKGIYFIEIQSEQGNETHKLIVQ